MVARSRCCCPGGAQPEPGSAMDARSCRARCWCCSLLVAAVALLACCCASALRAALEPCARRRRSRCARALKDELTSAYWFMQDPLPSPTGSAPSSSGRRARRVRWSRAPDSAARRSRALAGARRWPRRCWSRCGRPPACAASDCRWRRRPGRSPDAEPGRCGLRARAAGAPAGQRSGAQARAGAARLSSASGTSAQERSRALAQAQDAFEQSSLRRGIHARSAAPRSRRCCATSRAWKPWPKRSPEATRRRRPSCWRGCRSKSRGRRRQDAGAGPGADERRGESPRAGAAGGERGHRAAAARRHPPRPCSRPWIG